MNRMRAATTQIPICRKMKGKQFAAFVCGMITSSQLTSMKIETQSPRQRRRQIIQTKEVTRPSVQGRGKSVAMVNFTM